MAAYWSSHGGAFRLLLVMLLVMSAGALTLRPRQTKRRGHTLDDALISDITAADVEHNDAVRFVMDGIAHMKQVGIKLSDECETRYGYTFITDQKHHHFRLCKSEATLGSDGKLTGVSRSSSSLAVFRERLLKKQQAWRKRQQLLKALNKTGSEIDAAATAGSAAGAGAGKRRTLMQQHSSSTLGLASTVAVTAKARYVVSRKHLEDQMAGAIDGRPNGRATDCLSGQHSASSHVLDPKPCSASRCSSQISCSSSSAHAMARRHLQATENGNSSSSLMYKILKYVNTKKSDDAGDTSDVYNDAGDDDNDDNSGEGEGNEDAKAVGGGATAAAAAAAKKAAWLAKRRAAFLAAFEPDVEVPALTAVNSSFKSSVSCYLQPSMPRDVGYKDAQLMCVGRNVVLDTCGFYDGQNEGFEVRFPKPKVGAVKLGCTVQSSLLAERNLTKGYKNRVWWWNAQDNAYDSVRQHCASGSGHVVEHPVAFVLRDRYTHTLHELEVLATIFTSLAVANLTEIRNQGVQIVIADQMPHASYRATYAAISYPYRLRHLAEAPYPPNTCFRTALFINAFTNSIAFNPNPNTSRCFSPIMVGVHRWLRNLHKELDPAYLSRVHHHASETGGIVRRAVVWTSRRNLEALRLTSGAGMTEWQSARMVPNENEVVTALQSAILRWNSRSCLLARYYGGDEGMAGCRNSNVQFDLVFGEFSDWPYYPDQLLTIYRTGVLIGVHGAALTFITSLTAGESALLELAGLGWEEAQTGNMLNLFPSLAHNVGAYYEQVRYQGPDIDVRIATDALERAMDAVSSRIMAKKMNLELVPEQQPHFNDQYNFDIMFPQACPTSVVNKTRRYVTSHPIQMTLNDSSNAHTSGSVVGG
ncbi:hypothetical protein VOLCADRAFT_87643 [Volvox carteri f. nagariensis]|uniref:Uncharacterized protein n=1 Tax=Volvox carteri f. nagariensis TaxID=3068 RepID=D8TLV5_VOLCA|nr:uncharacterized protein VOLCADRAFT_87643 [Volvox carteri f. nagariensis]EFJ51530.1 hypothetical protein VOLCADRAFT_87643 [Volvox carteri f. nagariensis]|eukprot:XP_002947482.1 hypothetical protein VOLCADRAFT_87643 [Volvox carteri f. nagariensis]